MGFWDSITGDKSFGKSMIQNHKTGEITGKNTRVKQEVNVDREGFSSRANTIMDVIGMVGKAFETLEEVASSNELRDVVVSAYVEKEGGQYHTLVTFADGKSETRSFDYEGHALRLMRQIQEADGDLSMLRGSYLGSSDTILFKESSIEKVQRSGRTIRIVFDNNCAISVKYSSVYKGRDDFARLSRIVNRGAGPMYRRREPTSRRASARINRVLNS